MSVLRTNGPLVLILAQNNDGGTEAVLTCTDNQFLFIKNIENIQNFLMKVAAFFSADNISVYCMGKFS